VTALTVRRAVWPCLAALVTVGVLFLAVFPSRTWLAQRESIADTTERISVLREQNQALQARVRVLGTDAEIERLAREQYNLVRPGEEAYALLPPAPDLAPAPRGEWTERVLEAVAEVRNVPYPPPAETAGTNAGQ
jgi:cell division protein FtsB